MTGIRASCAAISALLLAACGGGPNDDDLRSALSAQAAAVGGKLGQDMFKTEIAKAKLVGCAKADAGGYRCDYIGPFGAVNARLVKADSGWVIVP